MSDQRQPWEQRDGESGTAYGAFRAFLGLGPARDVRSAYRQSRGKPAASEAPSSWRDWTTRYHWYDRAAAYDRHHEAIRQKEAEARSRRDGRLWGGLLDEALEARYKAGKDALERAREILKFPVRDVRLDRDGATTVVRAINSDELRRATISADQATQMMISSAKDAISLSSSDAGPPAAPGTQEAGRDEAARELQEWVRTQRERVMSSPSARSTPPTSPTLT